MMDQFSIFILWLSTCKLVLIEENLRAYEKIIKNALSFSTSMDKIIKVFENRKKVEKD